MEAVGSFELGEIKVHIGEPGKPMAPEFWAERAAEKIMFVSGATPEPIRQQALAFKTKIQYVILGAIKEAVAERKARDALLAEMVSPELAATIRGDD